ncbi:MAG: molybdenum cofactor guanylyltransferase [Opitutaceae bacterium]
MPFTFSAVLLAAGHSIRMHRDKALLEREGALMWQQQRDLLRAAGAAEIFLSAREDQAWAEAAEGFDGMVRDPSPDAGPLGGIVAALKKSTQSHLAVLAVDLPQMTPAWFASLRAGCAPGGGVVGRQGKFFEPLAAIYPQELRPLAEAALQRRELSLQKLLTAGVAQGLLRIREISAAEAPWFTNWNEPGR